MIFFYYDLNRHFFYLGEAEVHKFFDKYLFFLKCTEPSNIALTQDDFVNMVERFENRKKSMLILPK